MFFSNKWANVALIALVALVVAVIVVKSTKVVDANGTPSPNASLKPFAGKAATPAATK